ncbi:MAG: hypothetical protein HY700_15230 [Gemmatimonadetes bacterium]|nr:hypothetical protein [Gemmatimonadota bacterium]
MATETKDQVKRNYDAFVAKLPALLRSNAGKFALMRDGEIVEFFDPARDAYSTGLRLFKEEGQFSIQEVVEAPVDLGFYSHAVP